MTPILTPLDKMPAPVPSGTVASSEPAAVFDRLAQLYCQMESLLETYVCRAAQGELATEALALMHQLAEKSLAMLTSLSPAQSASAEGCPLATAAPAEKRQQVLAVLSRVLQRLALAEERTHELCEKLRPQTEALYQANGLRSAYELALATCLPSPSEAPPLANCDHSENATRPASHPSCAK